MDVLIDDGSAIRPPIGSVTFRKVASRPEPEREAGLAVARRDGLEAGAEVLRVEGAAPDDTETHATVKGSSTIPSSGSAKKSMKIWTRSACCGSPRRRPRRAGSRRARVRADGARGRSPTTAAPTIAMADTLSVRREPARELVGVLGDADQSSRGEHRLGLEVRSGRGRARPLSRGPGVPLRADRGRCLPTGVAERLPGRGTLSRRPTRSARARCA